MCRLCEGRGRSGDGGVLQQKLLTKSAVFSDVLQLCIEGRIAKNASFDDFSMWENSFCPQRGSRRAITRNQWGREHSYIRGQIQCALTCQNRFRNKTCRPVTNFVYERTFLIWQCWPRPLTSSAGIPLSH